ncbi:class II fructose-1,6-bisphosphate aldolase [Clostridium sp. 'deep sea']|uniref:class II fructose-1,6-bisphosphate aldolase n=1 Tax=Clostridium sp. 'deep sea' TaxID=2779445 RepID=UPI0018964F73|nr:class II fructose-1,6-bisphosphate aldolase [Clostridium sp. 'deep sea']QOR33997.1 class II fructose-1,6-bisphosphate aldolase [Clostridium sp. 'deep sea']
MSFVTLNEILKDAQKNRYAVGAFNTNNMEIVQAIIEAAVEEKAPVILQASQGALKYAGIDYIMGLVRAAEKTADIPIVMHLDHGTDFNQVMLCLRKGFTSVMIDGSKRQFEDNIAITKKVVEVAHPMGVTVEAELGKIGGTEDDVTVSEREATFTVPNEAKIFCEKTNVDALAVAIGTAHGAYKGEPKLDFERLKQIRALVDTPLVLHGASGVPEEAVKRAIELGVCKVNIDTNIRQAFTKGVQEYIAEHPEVYDPRKILAPAKIAMKEIIREKIRLFGSNNRC